jgi:hypothetical protein
MKWTLVSRFCCAGLIASMVIASAGCKSNTATPTAVSKSLGEIYTSQTFDTSYTGALNAYRQLMVGTVRLEGSENAITPEQAKLLLVLWQSLSGRALQSDAEREAVLAYIETHMTPAQLQAIAAMRLTENDLQTPPMDFGQGGSSGRGNAGQPGDSGTRLAPSRQAAPPAAASPRPAQAGGTVRGTSSGLTAGSMQDTVLLTSLIRLLSQRAAEGAASPASPRTPNRTPAPGSPALPTPARP